MQIYKARIKKPQYNIYTVHSDIESANVYFDNEIVGSIIDGVCYIRVDKKVDSLTHNVRLEGGSVPKTVVVYTFTGTTITVSANADSTLEMNPTASYKNTTVYNYNSNSYDLNFADGAEVTINSTPKTTKTELSWTPTTYNLQENFTEKAKQFKVTLTQTESNKTCVITINQAAGVEYTYTVNSDIEGATVLANGENVGTIENGKCVFTKWNTHAAESYPIEFEGGTLVPKANEYHLSNSVVPAVSELGDTIDLSDYIKSTVRAYSPYSPTGDVTKNGSVTLNTKYNYRDSSAGYNIDGDLVFDENQTTNKVTRTFTVTQTASGKKIEITVTQNAGVKYTYTVKSNIEGATVKFGTETVGTIKDGQLVVTKWNNHAAASYSVSFTGGTLVPKETEYTFSISDIPIQSAEAGSVNLSSYITSNKKVYTPQRPTGTVSRNNSVTLNTTYTSATSNVTYSPTTITVTENQTTKPVDYRKTITQDESDKTITAEFQQSAGVRYSYTVNSDVEGAKVSFSGISDTGTITDGKYVLIRWNSHAAASYTVSLSGGTMPKKDVVYTLSNSLRKPESVPATGEEYVGFITESTITYTSVMPANASCNRNSFVTMNTTYDGLAKNDYVGNYTVPENQTTDTKEYSYTYTHSKDSSVQITAEFVQEAGIAYTYTVNSNIEGSKITYSNDSTGTISGGKHVLTLWNNHAPANLTCTLSGGTLSEPEDYEYEFNITKIGNDNTSTDNAISVAGTGQSNMATTATSRKRRYEYHVPTTTFTINRNGSVTANETKSYSNYTTVSYSVSAKSQTWITNNGTNITVAKNPNDTARKGTITFTQAESNKTDIITVNQARGTYIYTINSNCNGGTVYFGTSNSSQTINVGTVSNGKCVFERTEANGYVRISGGVPDNVYNQYIDDGYDSGYGPYTEEDTRNTGSESVFRWQGENDSNRTMTNGTASYKGFSAQGNNYVVESYNRSYGERRTRSYYQRYPQYHYRDTVYTAPSVKSVTGDSSVTMNYSSNVTNGTTQTGSAENYNYGSWSSWSSYDNKSGVKPTVIESVCSFDLSSSDSSKGLYTYQLSLGQNNGTSNRDYKATISRSGKNNLYVTGDQYRSPYSTLEFYGGGTSKSLEISGEYGHINENVFIAVSLGWEDGEESYTPFAIAKKSDNTADKSDWLNVGAYSGDGNYKGIKGAMAVKFSATGANPSTTARKGHIKFQQTWYDKKTIQINVTQRGISQTYSATMSYLSGASSQSSSGTRYPTCTVGRNAATVKYLVKGSVDAGTFSWDNIDFAVTGGGASYGLSSMVGSQVTLSVNVPANNTGSSRTIKVTLTSNNVQIAMLTITQIA